MGAVHYNARELVQLICRGLQDVNFQSDGFASGKAYAIGQ